MNNERKGQLITEYLEYYARWQTLSAEVSDIGAKMAELAQGIQEGFQINVSDAWTGSEMGFSWRTQNDAVNAIPFPKVDCRELQSRLTEMSDLLRHMKSIRHEFDREGFDITALRDPGEAIP